MHLIGKHMFPKNYDFFIVDSGIDKRSSMLRPRHRRHSSAASRALARGQQSGGAHKSPDILEKEPRGDPLEIAAPSISLVEESMPTRPRKSSLPSRTTSDADMEGLSSTLSALKFVPPSVRFGRGGRKGGFSRS